jgi:hypothetical protein
MLNFIRPYRMTQQWFAVLGVALLIGGVVLADSPAISDPTGNLPNGTEVPGTFPETVSAANVNIAPVSGSELGGSGSNDLLVSFPSSGPIAWTDLRHNEGDLAFGIGPFNPNDESYYPPATHGEWKPLDGQPFSNATLSWRVNAQSGGLLASVRHNGVNNGDNLGGAPVGVTHGVAYFITNGQGWGFRQNDGVFADGGNGSSDLIMGVAGFDGEKYEASFNVAAASFPYAEGWHGAWVNAGSDGVATFSASHPNIFPSSVMWTGGSAHVTLRNVDSASDGMLFVAPSNGSSQTKIAAATPRKGGWDVTVREDENDDISGASLTTDNQFQFLYIPYDTNSLIGGHVAGHDGSMVNEASASRFSLTRKSDGAYALSVFNAGDQTKLTEADGMLILSVASPMAGTTDLADRSFLSYEYDSNSGDFIIQSRELAEIDSVDSENQFGDWLTLRDSDFYFAFIDFKTPPTTKNTPLMGPPVISDPGNQLPTGAELPGAFPEAVSGANVNMAPVSGSELGGSGSNDLLVSFLSSGPVAWTDLRHNEGDIAFGIGPFDPTDASYYPPAVHGEWKPLDGQPYANATLAWRVNTQYGGLLASVRHNGVNNGDTLGGKPVGTTHGVAYFITGGQGWGFRQNDGVFADGGNGSSDLIMGVAGFDDSKYEASFNVAAASFPYAEGWHGAWVNASSDGAATFSAAHPGVLPGLVTWTDGSAHVVLPEVNSASDGMLFVAPSNGDSKTRIAAAAPRSGGWDVTVREDENDDISGATLTEANQFQFLYIPYDTNNLVGGHVNGSDGSMINDAGSSRFGLKRNSDGEYALSVFNTDGEIKLNEEDGMIILSVASPMLGNSNLADRSFLSYEYDSDSGDFIIQSRELVEIASPHSENQFGDWLKLRDSDFYFAFVDFEEPLNMMTP